MTLATRKSSFLLKNRIYFLCRLLYKCSATPPKARIMAMIKSQEASGAKTNGLRRRKARPSPSNQALILPGRFALILNGNFDNFPINISKPRNISSPASVRTIFGSRNLKPRIKKDGAIKIISVIASKIVPSTLALFLRRAT